ncbi:MAG: MATE family efflux transporter [Ruminococcaceae bacterium]|nr:MATE family efflux transporter [Oscillospiraceae bacterium]
MDAAQKKFIRMTTEPVNKLVCQLAVPTIISMLVTSLYNMVDTFFVGQVGTEATAGVGLIFPVMTIIQAFGFYFGQGSGNFISRALGARKNQEAEIMSATSFICSLLFGCFLMVVGFIFKPQILTLLGASTAKVSPATVAYADDYLTLILIGAPFMGTSFVLNNQLRFQGNAIFSMIGLVVGAVINCVLDPLFIFGFHMEVTGAALATIISQFISFCLLYIATLKSDSMKIRLRNFRLGFYWQKGIFMAGAPSLFRQGLASFATLALNSAAAIGADPAMADAAIAAFSVVGKVMMFAFSALLGFGQGFQPVCGYNYGAKKYDRVRNSFTFCLKVGGACLLALSILGFIFAEPVISLFRDDPNVIAIGTIAMRWQCCTFPLMTVVACTNMLYQNIGRVVGATLLAVARQGLMFIPVVLILPHLFEQPIMGVYLAQPAADLFAFALAAPLAVSMYRELKKLEKDLNKAEE